MNHTYAEIIKNLGLMYEDPKKLLTLSNKELINLVDMTRSRDLNTVLTALDVLAQLDYRHYCYVIHFVFTNWQKFHNLRVKPLIANEVTANVAQFWSRKFKHYDDLIGAIGNTITYIKHLGSISGNDTGGETALIIFEEVINKSELYLCFPNCPIDHRYIRIRRN